MALVSVSIRIGVFAVLAWTVAQGGLFYVNATFATTEVVANLTGSNSWSTRTLLVNMWNEQVFGLDLRTYLLPYLLNGFKICDSARLDKASVVRALAWPFVLAHGISLFTAIWLRYVHTGGLIGSGHTWFQTSTQTPFRWISSLRAYPTTFQLMDLVHFVFGAGVTLAMAWTRVHFSWFALHPIGFIVASGWPAGVLWFSLFIGWILKSAVMRWAGYKAYQTLRPFFFGLIIGNSLHSGLWTVIHYITGPVIV